MILSEFYSRTELMRALRRGGFYMKGTRLNSLSLHELTDFWQKGSSINRTWAFGSQRTWIRLPWTSRPRRWRFHHPDL